MRVVKPEGPDAFLLEPIFSNEVWNHLGAPISRENEAAVIKAVADEAEAARQGMLAAELAAICLSSCDRRSSTPSRRRNGGPTPRS